MYFGADSMYFGAVSMYFGAASMYFCPDILKFEAFIWTVREGPPARSPMEAEKSALPK